MFLSEEVGVQKGETIRAGSDGQDETHLLISASALLHCTCPPEEKGGSQLQCEEPNPGHPGYTPDHGMALFLKEKTGLPSNKGSFTCNY